MKPEKPTSGDIWSLYQKTEDYYSKELWDAFKDDEKYYELEFKGDLRIPDEYHTEGIVLPTARDMVDTYVDHIDISNARVFVNKYGTHDSDKESADMLRKFYLGTIQQTNVESDISPWRVASKHYGLHGLGVFKTTWDKDSDKYPIRLEAVPPSNILPDPTFGDRNYVFERYKRILFDVKRMYPYWTNPKGKKDVDAEVEYITYWDKYYRCDFLDGQPVLRIRGGVDTHKYGFIPYVLIESGLGNLSPEASPAKRYVGMLRYIFDMLRAESRGFSLADIVLSRAALPWGVIEGDNAAAVGQIQAKFGTFTPLPEGVTIKEMVSPVPPDALNGHLARLSYYISAHAAPNSVRGLPEQGVRSGADRRLLIAEAATRYQYSRDAFRHGTSKVLTNCAKLLKNKLPDNVRVWARTPNEEFNVEIKKDKLKEPFTCYVEFAPISEQDEYVRHDDLERLVKSMIVTPDWARRQMSNVDAEAMSRDEEKMLLKQSPTYIAFKEQILQAVLQEELGEAGILPPPAGAPTGAGIEEAGRRIVPPVPNRAPLGSPENLQNEMEGMRSQTPINPTQGMGGGGNR
uniref:Portal protein n=1 Tax=viral metagenome TaxID=1070528 RepID=A0A6H1ZGH6_9ZZZZ